MKDWHYFTKLVLYHTKRKARNNTLGITTQGSVLVQGEIPGKNFSVRGEFVVLVEVILHIGQRRGDVFQIPWSIASNCLVSEGADGFQVSLERGHVEDVSKSRPVDLFAGLFFHSRKVVIE